MYTSIAGLTLQTYTLYLALAVALSAGVVLYRLGGIVRWRVLADVFVAMLAAGWVLARLEYVLLNPDIFAGDVLAIVGGRPGGLAWHGALSGALLGLWAAAGYHRQPLPTLLEALTPALPLVAFAGWTACRAAGCAHGATVETLAYYPAWMVTESRDIYGIIAPRYDTVSFGQALSLALLVIVGVGWWRGEAVRSWLVVVVFCAGMMAIGAVRGDDMPLWLGVRAGQWLTGLLLTGALWLAVRGRQQR